jgi:hypothetical protein
MTKNKNKCWNSGARVMLSVGEALAGRTRCSRCGRVLKVRVPSGVDEATLPTHNEVKP